MSDLLTTTEAARLLRCTAQTVRRRLLDRTLAGGKLGRRWLVHRRSLGAAAVYDDLEQEPTGGPIRLDALLMALLAVA